MSSTLDQLRRWQAARLPGGRKSKSQTRSIHLTAMQGGERLCVQHGKNGLSYWLEPSRKTVPRPVAEKLIQHHDVTAAADGLFGDIQTWSWRGVKP